MQNGILLKRERERERDDVAITSLGDGAPTLSQGFDSQLNVTLRLVAAQWASRYKPQCLTKPSLLLPYVLFLKRETLVMKC